ncbi:hypothetical protein CDAR_572031 [Caerostris darwini]|uniref:Uncharacterized protein n=1 Tax=Caerostris darwini TaxID=1538125 RepID=A0AAV4MUS5_9ARAC|nr:hypothetical protein CDAR_572031 [Caerostris darwini]
MSLFERSGSTNPSFHPLPHEEDFISSGRLLAQCQPRRPAPKRTGRNLPFWGQMPREKFSLGRCRYYRWRTLSLICQKGPHHKRLSPPRKTFGTTPITPSRTSRSKMSLFERSGSTNPSFHPSLPHEEDFISSGRLLAQCQPRRPAPLKRTGRNLPFWGKCPRKSFLWGVVVIIVGAIDKWDYWEEGEKPAWKH